MGEDAPGYILAAVVESQSTVADIGCEENAFKRMVRVKGTVGEFWSPASDLNKSPGNG
jgi:hypothetical protein